MTLSPAEVVERMTAAFNSGELDAGVTLIHPEAIDHAPVDGPFQGPEAWRERWASTRAAMPDLVVEVEQVVTQGEMVARRLHLTGHRSGQIIDTLVLDMVRVRDGLLVEHWALMRT